MLKSKLLISGNTSNEDLYISMGLDPINIFGLKSLLGLIISGFLSLNGNLNAYSLFKNI